MEDLNQSFYHFETFEDRDFEETQQCMENLSLSNKKKNTSNIFLRLTPKKILTETVGQLLKERSSFKKCRVCGQLKNIFEMRNHEKRCKSRKHFLEELTDSEMFEFKCSFCYTIFPRRSLLNQHKSSKLCGDITSSDSNEHRKSFSSYNKIRKRCQIRGVWCNFYILDLHQRQFVVNILIRVKSFTFQYVKVREVRWFKWSVSRLIYCLSFHKLELAHSNHLLLHQPTSTENCSPIPNELLLTWTPILLGPDYMQTVKTHHITLFLVQAYK